MKVRVCLSLLVATALCARGADAEDLARSLVGAWRLVSTQQRLSDGSTRPSPLYGPDGVGYLHYSASGRMCAVLMDPHRAAWKSRGRYEVNEQHGFVIHHVEMDVVPNSAGTDLKRYVSLEGNRLTLRPAESFPGGVVEYTLTWERVEGPLTSTGR